MRGGRLLSALAVALALGALAARPTLAGPGPREGEATAATCAEAQTKARELATRACQKHGGLAWTEFSLDCETDAPVMPGVPVSLQVHYLCGGDL